MQVNSLSTNEHTTYMKEGCCFSYSQTGHIQCACPLKDKKATMPSRNPFRPNTAAVSTTPSKGDQIRTLLKEMTQDEKDTVLKDFV